MLLSGRCRIPWSSPSGDAFLVRSDPGALVCCFGAVETAAVADAVGAGNVQAVLCPFETAPPVISALRGWEAVTAMLHCLPAGLDPTTSEPSARPAMLSRADGALLSHVPEPQRAEILDAIECSHVAAAILEGVPVSFCYPVYETETLWDVSVDTLEPYRRRGLARTCFEYLFEHMTAHGKSPVWGALANNPASSALARSIGFTEVDRSLVFLRAGDRKRRA